MWCTVLGFLLYLLVLFFWRPSKSIFLDVLCIDQEDEQRKMEGVISMGAFVKCSDVLLVLWDSTPGRRIASGMFFSENPPVACCWLFCVVQLKDLHAPTVQPSWSQSVVIFR